MPYSESIGFITDLTAKEDIDMVFYVVAHETGHQWWAHQVMGAAMQGSTLLSESMSQYAALMVMEKEYGTGPHAQVPEVRRRQIPERARLRGHRRAAVVDGGEPRLHPLQQGQRDAVQPAFVPRRGHAEQGVPLLGGFVRIRRTTMAHLIGHGTGQ
jgi:hypothetical protein